MLPLKLCANGGMQIDATGLVVPCCDPCDISIDAERERIQKLRLVNFTEYGEGLLNVRGFDYSADKSLDTNYHAKAVFDYTYYQNETDSFPLHVLEYFDCENCELHVVYRSIDPELSYRFFPMPDICNGCVFKFREPLLLATIDEGGPHEDTFDDPVIRALYSYTNTTDKMQYVFWTEGGNVAPSNRWIDNFAQILKNGQTPHEGEDIFHVILFPNETATLYDINESHNTDYNPWELHCRVYVAEITCDPCEVAVYRKMYESEDESLVSKYGAGFYTGNGSNAPYRKAFVLAYNSFTLRLYGVTCDTCEIVLLESWGAWDDEHVVPYTEDDTACDGEGEVQ